VEVAVSCDHYWIPNSGRGGEPEFKFNRQMSAEPTMHVMCSTCGDRTWLTEKQWAEIPVREPPVRRAGAAELKSDQRVYESMPKVAQLLDSTLTGVAGERLGFVLFVFPFNRPGVCSKVQNVETKAGISMLEQMLDYMKRCDSDVTHHEVH
jgi:hypothetical protein